MFGSITNWVNTNVSQNIPTVSMPSMPTMPTMPAMPHMPDLFNKNKKSDDASNPDAVSTPTEQPIELQQQSTADLVAKLDFNHIEPVVDEQLKQTESESVQQEGDAADPSKFGFIDPSKAIGNVKDIGNNIGSMSIIYKS